MRSDSPLLYCEDLSAGYGKIEIVHDIDLEVNRGEIVGIIGHNGAGKSTAMKSIIGTNTTHSGSVHFKGEPITALKPHKRARRGIGYLPQKNSVFNELSIEENLRMASHAHAGGYEEQIDQVYDLFPDIEEMTNTTAHTLSGGQKKMLALACCMIIDPDLYLLDEPSDGLAPELVEDVFERITEFQSEGKAVLINEQSEEVLEYVDRLYLLKNGSIETAGTPDEMVSEGIIQRSYFA